MPEGMIGTQAMDQDDIFTGTHCSVVDGYTIAVDSMHITWLYSFLFYVA
jgi:hypothetical protein